MTNQIAYSVWVGGSEINPYYLSKESAELIAQVWKGMGYDDVQVVEEVIL